MKRVLLPALALLMGATSFAQQKKDKSMFKEYEPGYYQNSILKDIRMVNEKLEKKDVDKRFFMDQSGMDLPNKISLYKDNTAWANPTISQGNGGTCWSFSTTSFMESEVYRLHKKKVKISEIYTAYWEYVEKARRFVQERGNSVFGQGAEANSVTRIWKQYGACPTSAYTGLLNGRKFHTHEKMYKEMMAFLNGLKVSNDWNEERALETIKAIMNHYIGTPPTKFTVEGKEYTPKSYVKDYLKMNMDDYVEILSYKQEPYWQQVEYKVPDNWWHSEEYYNIPLDDFMKVLKRAIRKGYTMSIGGDVSEAGFLRTTNCAMVPSFDIPSEYIDENARQFRFSNETTTDDHGMHMVGFYVDKNGKDWYLIKDSSSGSRNVDENTPEFGYYFFHEDYVKLKMMGFTIHKDAVKDILKKFK
jgi:bleomycin hydrolase